MLYLIKFVVESLIFSHEKYKQLFVIPVEQRIQISLEIKHDVTQVLLFLLSTVIWYIFSVIK